MSQNEEPIENFNPRNYQLELYQHASRENTIVYLPTGSGKTMIAVLLIRDLTAQAKKTLAQDGRRIVFLVPTVILAKQQANYIRRHTCLKVGEYYGELGVDLWRGDRWETEFETNNVLVMTAQLFVNAVNHAFISVGKIALLVIDECHRAVKDSPMKQALIVLNKMSEHKGAESVPRVLGLTAALFLKKCKPKEVAKRISKLKMTMKSEIRTAHPHKISGYSTKPIEVICQYSSWQENVGNTNNTAWLSSHIQELLDACLNEFQISFENDSASNCPVELIDILREIKILTDIFGPYGTNHTVSIFLKEITRLGFQSMKNSEQDRFFKIIMEMLEEIRNICESIFGELNPLERLRLFTTPHVTRLMDILRQFSPDKFNKTDTFTPLCSIVFVERRSSANVLYHILREASQCDPGLSYLSPLFTMGQASGNPKGKMKEANHLNQNQNQIIRRFRDGSCNLLVATSVLEEGVDVRSCNLVIRFDGIKTYCDYVQSKGRARSPNAFYILMEHEKSLNTFLDTLAGFHCIEQSLLDPSSLLLSSVTDDEPIDQDMEDYWQKVIGPYCPNPNGNGPRVTLLSSVGLLNWYCSTLPSDGSAPLVPYFTVNKLSARNLTAMDKKYREHLEAKRGSTIQNYFQCTLLLPLNCPLRDELIGRVMPSIRLAKQEVSLQACIRLHQLGELDDQHLMPLSKSVVDNIKDDDVNFDCELDSPQGSDYYRRGITRLFDGPLVPPFYLYLITYQVMINDSNQQGNVLFDPNRAQRRMGFLSTQKLPAVNPFGLFSAVGQINVGFLEIDSFLRLNPDDIKLCQRFQQFLFENILELTKGEQYNAGRGSCLFVPIDSTNRQIDFAFMNEQLDSTGSDWQRPSPASRNVGDYYKVFSDAVVTSHHDQTKGKSSCYYVNAVCEKLTPLSSFPNPAFPTYFSYYRDRHQVQIENTKQPLLQVRKESFKTFNFLTPKYVNRKGAASLDGEKLPKESFIHLVPEFCDVHRFPASMWRQAVWIPSIFYRLNSLLLADELRIEIQAKTGLGISVLSSNLQWEPLQMKNNCKGQLSTETLEMKNDEKDLNSAIDGVKTMKVDVDEEDVSMQNDENMAELNEEEDDVDLKITIWNVDLFIPDEDQSSPKKAAKFKSKKKKQISTENSSMTRGENVRFDDGPTNSCPRGPSPGEVLQALTTSVANAGYDLERLEVMGDSFLKLSTSIRVYCDSPSHFHEGKMTHLRMMQVCNQNLFKLGKSKSIPRFVVASKFAPKENWLPLCYLPNDTDYDCMETEEKPNAKLWQKMSKKAIADSMEALIGLYLTLHGVKGALKVMRWMGVDVPDPGVGVCSFGGIPPSPLLTDYPRAEYHLEEHLAGFETLERNLNYRFVNRFYLLQAFSHASYHHNRMTSCYQRLEFLGDAVFDYLITKYLYDSRLYQLTPGALSDMRSALVNNVTFAVLAVRNGFHRYLKHMVPDIHQAIDRFVQQQELCDHAMPDEFFLIGTQDDLMTEDVEVPKVLGDIFESLVGAVFLDSDMSLDAVWRVFYPLIRGEIDACTQIVPMSPIRKIYEKYPGRVQFKALEKIPDGRICIAVEVNDNGRLYKGVGKNSRIAKNTAAKYALSQLGI